MLKFENYYKFDETFYLFQTLFNYQPKSTF